MRRLAASLIVASAAALSACKTAAPPDHSFPVFFNDFATTLGPVGVGVVNNAAAVAKQYPRAKVTVVGYADQSGSAERETALSQGRADTVSKLLVQAGIDPARITTTAGGLPPNSQPGVERRRAEIDLDLP